MDNNTVDNIINYDNYKLQGVQARKYYMITCASLFLIGYIFYFNLFIATFMAFLALPFKKTYIKFKIKQQKEILRQQFGIYFIPYPPQFLQEDKCQRP